MAVSALNQVEAAILNGAASALNTYSSQIASALGSVEVTIINGALHVADDAFAKLPFGLGGLIDSALANYATTIEPNLPKYTENGLAGVATYLKDVAAKLLAG